MGARLENHLWLAQPPVALGMCAEEGKGPSVLALQLCISC